MVLAALEYYRVPAAYAVARVQQGQGAAYHDRRVSLRGHEDVRAHTRRRGFAVGAGDAERVVIVLHDRAPGLRALEHRHAPGLGLDYLGVIVAHSGGAHHELDIRRYVHRRVAYLDVYAQAAQVARLLALGHVRAVYHQAHTRQHLRQRRHRDSARADQMPALARFQILFKVCHICSKPSKNLILSFP